MLHIENLNKKCKDIRKLILKQISSIGVGHIGGSLSIVEVLVYLYYYQMNIDPKKPKMDGRDRLVLSKGHAGPALYAVLADRGYFDISELDTLNKPGTKLPSHCDMNRTIGIDMTTGSLGQGLSCAVGMSLASKIKGDNAYIYCILGDGEIQEGQIWEAAMASSHFKLDNLVAILDYNKMQITNDTNDIMNIDPIEDKWKAFGWNVIRVQGHDILQIHNAIESSRGISKKPTMIVLDTIKGKGVKFAEDAGVLSHSMTISREMLEVGLKQLEGGEEVYLWK